MSKDSWKRVFLAALVLFIAYCVLGPLGLGALMGPAYLVVAVAYVLVVLGLAAFLNSTGRM
jgi:phosphoglycerol transferase MdoB-like AlkP superfamily enzyme